jgi:hypothetical protein
LAAPLIAADLANSQIIYAASGANICKSTNGRQQFHCVALTFASFQTTLTSLLIDPQQPATLYAVVPDPKVSGALYTLASANNTAPLLFWKSADGGATWNSYPFPTGPAGPLAVDPANPQIMFAGAFRSADGGRTWQPTNASRAIQPVFASCADYLRRVPRQVPARRSNARLLDLLWRYGKTAIASTLLGGSCYDHPTNIALSASGAVCISGETDSANFRRCPIPASPTHSPPWQPTAT